MDRMSPLDATFLHIEDGVNHMHIASCARFEGPAPTYEALVDLFRGHLPLVPRYRQKVRFVDAVAEEFAQRNRRVEAQHRVAPVDQHRQQVAQGTDLLPGFGEQRLQHRILLAGFAPPKYGHRDQLHVEARIGEGRLAAPSP